MLVTTLADELRSQKPGARVVSLSLKPRSAIGLAGHGGDAVVWFDDPSRSFVTSTAFARTPVPDVARFMAEQPFESQQDRVWALAAPAASYRYGDVQPGEQPNAGWTAVFPHVLADRAPADAAFADHWQKSPYSDAYLGRLGSWLVDQWQLGQRETTDFLGISFSALDMVGHDFGPRSREVEDMLIELDATIGTLVDHLDRAVGRHRYVLALTSDHGVADIPEQAARRTARPTKTWERWPSRRSSTTGVRRSPAGTWPRAWPGRSTSPTVCSIGWQPRAPRWRRWNGPCWTCPGSYVSCGGISSTAATR